MQGMEHWDNEQCYIVISNHQSSLDILGKAYILSNIIVCVVMTKVLLI